MYFIYILFIEKFPLKVCQICFAEQTSNVAHLNTFLPTIHGLLHIVRITAVQCTSLIRRNHFIFTSK